MKNLKIVSLIIALFSISCESTTKNIDTKQDADNGEEKGKSIAYNNQNYRIIKSGIFNINTENEASLFDVKEEVHLIISESTREISYSEIVPAFEAMDFYIIDKVVKPDYTSYKVKSKRSGTAGSIELRRQGNKNVAVITMDDSEFAGVFVIK